MRNRLFSLALMLLAACGTEEESSEQHLARAKDFITASNYTSATIELQNALQLEGASAEARWLLGKIYLDAGDILTAEKELQHAQALGWTANDVRPALAKTLLGQGNFAAVLALESQDLNAQAAALLLSSQALAALSDRQPDKAHTLVAQALHKEPQLREAQLAQATIALHEGDPTDALTLTGAILAQAPDTGEAWWLKGQALLQQGKLEDARAAFDQSIAHSTIGFADRIARALISVQLEDYAAAQTDATKLLQQSPKDPAANYVQGLLDFHNKDYRKALSTLTLAEPAAGQFPLVLYYLSMGYLIDKNLPLAEQFANQFVATAPNDSNGRKLLAAILVLQNKVEDAQNMLRSVLEQNPDDVAALNIMANALLLDDQADIGMVMYARIAQLQPDWQFAPLRLEAALVTSDSGAAGPLTARAHDNAANYPQTDILSILRHLAKKDFPSAIEVATHYHIQDFESLAPFHVLGRVYLAAGQPADAEDVFKQALTREPGDPIANLSLAEMALQAGDKDAARQYYQTALDHHPDDLTTLLQLAALEAREKNAEAMIARLNQTIAAHPTVLEPRVRLASYYMDSGSPQKVDPVLAPLTALQRRSPGVLELTGLAQLAQKQNDSALATLQQLADAIPASAQAHYLLAMAASATGDPKKSKQQLLEAVQRDPKHVPALMNLARIARYDGDQAQFEQHLATLVALAPDAPDVLRLQALSAQASGDAVAALTLSQRAFKAAPTTQSVLELTALQKAAGSNEAARNTLQQWIKDHPTDVAVRLYLANELELGNDSAAAQVQYIAVLNQEPGNVIALNNLAWNLRLKNPGKALELIHSAISHAPNLPVLLDTLAVIESTNGDHQSARKTIQRARAALPDDATVRYHEAMITAALGDTAQAIAALEELLGHGVGQFTERAEAEGLLKALKGEAPTLPTPG